MKEYVVLLKNEPRAWAEIPYLFIAERICVELQHFALTPDECRGVLALTRAIVDVQQAEDPKLRMLTAGKGDSERTISETGCEPRKGD